MNFRMTALSIVSSFFLIGFLPDPATASPGSEWRSAPEEIKINFINGAVTGMRLSDSLAYGEFRKFSQESMKASNLISANREDYLYALDRFYEDPANSRVDRVGAMLYCYMQLKGETNLDLFLKNLRSQAQ